MVMWSRKARINEMPRMLESVGFSESSNRWAKETHFLLTTPLIL